MRKFNLLALVICCVFEPILPAQDITGSQTTIVLDKGTVKASEKVELRLHVDRPSNYSGSIIANFAAPANSNGSTIQFAASLAAGQQDVTLETVIPADAVGGTYTLSGVYFSVSRTYTLSFTPITLTVEPTENPIVPSSARVTLDPTEKQFLATNATALKQILEVLKASLDRDASDTPRLRASLLQATKDADTVFAQASRGYQQLKKKALPSPPIFFEDFEAHFRQAIEGLSSPSSVAQRSEPVGSRLLRVQATNMKTAPHSYPLLALGVIDLLQKAIKAFDLSDEKDSYYFDVSIESRPSGATIYYTRLLHPYEHYPSQTDIPKMTLQYAFWTIFFDKQGCDQARKDLDPYNDPNPKLIVDISCHGSRQ